MKPKKSEAKETKPKESQQKEKLERDSSHTQRFEQLLDDAILGVKKK